MSSAKIHKLTLILALFVSFSAQALQINCKALNKFTGDEVNYANFHFAIAGINGFDCRTSKGKVVDVQVFGIGPGIRADVGSVISISCPLISHKRLLRRIAQQKALVLVGADAAATAGLGARVGVFANHRGGVCVLAGATLGLGASVEISTLVISERDWASQQAFTRGDLLEKIFAW